MYGAVWIVMVSDFLSYWGNSVPGVVGDVWWSGGFFVEFLTILVLFGSTITYAIIGWKMTILPNGVGALLVLSVLAVVPVNFLITDYWPNALVVPLSIAWAVIAIWVLSSSRRLVRISGSKTNPVRSE